MSSPVGVCVAGPEEPLPKVVEVAVLVVVEAAWTRSPRFHALVGGMAGAMGLVVLVALAGCWGWRQRGKRRRAMQQGGAVGVENLPENELYRRMPTGYIIALDPTWEIPRDTYAFITYITHMLIRATALVN
jgi:hypothetical protein